VQATGQQAAMPDIQLANCPVLASLAASGAQLTQLGQLAHMARDPPAVQSPPHRPTERISLGYSGLSAGGSVCSSVWRRRLTGLFGLMGQ
jgi:hypothetical protein